MSDIRSRGSVGQNLLNQKGQIRGFEGDGEAAPSQADHGGKNANIRILYVHGQCLLPFPSRGFLSHIAKMGDGKGTAFGL